MGPIDSPVYIASIELGLNSFRMLVAEMMDGSSKKNFGKVEFFREKVRLADGLRKDRVLSERAYRRGIKSITRFGDILRSFQHIQVSVVAENAFRVVRNANSFIAEIESILRHPVRFLIGIEEARLVYSGVVHEKVNREQRHLVIHVGGSSTELIIGDGERPILMESLYLGSATHSEYYFPQGYIDVHSFKEAEAAAIGELSLISHKCISLGWDLVISTSGLTRELVNALYKTSSSSLSATINIDRTSVSEAHQERRVLSQNSIQFLKRELLKCHHVEQISIFDVNSDKRPILPGGLAILSAIFSEFNITEMEVSNFPLVFGLLYELSGSDLVLE